MTTPPLRARDIRRKLPAVQTASVFDYERGRGRIRFKLVHTTGFAGPGFYWIRTDGTYEETAYGPTARAACAQLLVLYCLAQWDLEFGT